MRRGSPTDRQGPGNKSRPEGEGSGLSQWRRKDITKKGETKGIGRDVAAKGELTGEGRGGRNSHKAWGFRGQEGCWGAGQRRQGSERRDGRWRPEVVDDCPGEKEIQDRKRRERIRRKRAV